MRLTAWFEQNLWNMICAISLGVMSFVAGNATNAEKMINHEQRIALLEKRDQENAEFRVCVRLLDVWRNNGAKNNAPCVLGGM